MSTDVTHLAPPLTSGFRGRGYCGRNTTITSPERSRVTCTDCHAAYRADQKAR